jgi:hypothetical protein
MGYDHPLSRYFQSVVVEFSLNLIDMLHAVLTESVDVVELT